MTGFFDKCEKALKCSPFKNIIQGIYGGQTAGLIKCLNCGYVKQNIQDFNNISIEVKDMKGVDDSFKKYIEPEIISDYKCDKC